MNGLELDERGVKEGGKVKGRRGEASTKWGENGKRSDGRGYEGRGDLKKKKRMNGG